MNAVQVMHIFILAYLFESNFYREAFGCGSKRVSCLSKTSYKFCFVAGKMIMEFGNLKYCPENTICDENRGIVPCVRQIPSFQPSDLLTDITKDTPYEGYADTTEDIQTTELSTVTFAVENSDIRNYINNTIKWPEEEIFRSTPEPERDEETSTPSSPESSTFKITLPYPTTFDVRTTRDSFETTPFAKITDTTLTYPVTTEDLSPAFQYIPIHSTPMQSDDAVGVSVRPKSEIQTLSSASKTTISTYLTSTNNPPPTVTTPSRISIITAPFSVPLSSTEHDYKPVSTKAAATETTLSELPISDKTTSALRSSFTTLLPTTLYPSTKTVPFIDTLDDYVPASVTAPAPIISITAENVDEKFDYVSVSVKTTPLIISTVSTTSSSLFKAIPTKLSDTSATDFNLDSITSTPETAHPPTSTTISYTPAASPTGIIKTTSTAFPLSILAKNMSKEQVQFPDEYSKGEDLNLLTSTESLTGMSATGSTTLHKIRKNMTSLELISSFLPSLKSSIESIISHLSTTQAPKLRTDPTTAATDYSDSNFKQVQGSGSDTVESSVKGYLPICKGYGKYPSEFCNRYYECVRIMWWFQIRVRICRPGTAFKVPSQSCEPDRTCRNGVFG